MVVGVSLSTAATLYDHHPTTEAPALRAFSSFHSHNGDDQRLLGESVEEGDYLGPGDGSVRTEPAFANS